MLESIENQHFAPPVLSLRAVCNNRIYNGIAMALPINDKEFHSAMECLSYAYVLVDRYLGMVTSNTTYSIS